MGDRPLRLARRGLLVGDADTAYEDASVTHPVSDRRDELRRLLGEAQAACRIGKHSMLESLYRRVLTLDERCPEAWYGLGMLSLQRGSLDEAYDYLSEYATLKIDRDRAQQVEVVLFFLERVMGAGDELPPDIQEELEEQFLISFSEPGWIDEPLLELGGLSPREMVRTRDGKTRLLELMREMNWFQEAAAQMALERFEEGNADGCTGD